MKALPMNATITFDNYTTDCEFEYPYRPGAIPISGPMGMQSFQARKGKANVILPLRASHPAHHSKVVIRTLDRTYEATVISHFPTVECWIEK
jgi:hypothetical protein